MQVRAWLLCVAFVLPRLASSQACELPTARVISAQGVVEAQRAGQSGWVAVHLDDRFCAGDALRVQGTSRAAIALPDQTVVRLDQNSSVTFPAPRDDKQTWIEVLEGLLHVISRDPRALRVITPFADAGIDGTEFLVTVTPREATVLVLEGQVTVNAVAGGRATARMGEQVTAAAGQPPVTAVVVRPRDAVQWTLYYPPVYSRGTTPGASDARELVSEASRDLALGQVDDARGKLTRVEALEPQNAEALALRSIVALTQNDKDTARALADQSVAADPRSTTALIARSYVQQAVFDLPGALESLQAAVGLEPGNALAQARLAELRLSVGDSAAAIAAAKLAVVADPALALPYTVLGFADLARVDTETARGAFAEAIRLDSAAPLPRLGLGLAKIRDGDLAGGREEIEIAVLLDPNNALVRSYMGKAFYEEKRDKLAAGQLDTAKALDPNDPTAFFYDAIRKQTVNRPVEALQDLQRSVDLNGNRAVYRSRLQLDEDLAARSAALGRIYRDLGFEELALREGWKSVSADPSDYSGHRLLADSYSALPYHEIARVNELVQSQLLQPLNLTPIQSQLAQSNSFLLGSAGPSSVAFNEFNPLFNRNDLAIQASGVLGGKGTRGDDFTVAGIWNRASFSLGQFHFETDGFRTNNDLDENAVNAFVQYELGISTTLLAEARFTSREEGDLVLKFDPSNFDGSSRLTEHNTSVRLGLRHGLTSRSTILALFTHENGGLTYAVPGAPPFSDTVAFDTYSGELQHLYRGNAWRLTTGARYATADNTELTVTALPIPDPPFFEPFTSTTPLKPHAFTAYTYGELDLPGQLTVTMGLSADFVADSTFRRDRINPKFGLAWEPREGTRVRAGAFQTLQRPTVSREDIQPSLEPTPVAGFNQFFRGDQSEQTQRYGLAVDQRIPGGAYAGVELSRRNRDVPFFSFDLAQNPPLVTTVAKVTESNGGAYFDWTLGSRAAVRVQYEYDLVDNNPQFNPQGFTALEIHRVPASLFYFHPAGPSAGVTATWVHERGVFQTNLADPTISTPDEDEFWVVDAFVAYRLPERWGILRLDARNLLDSHFRFQDFDPESPRIVPERLLLVKLTVAY